MEEVCRECWLVAKQEEVPDVPLPRVHALIPVGSSPTFLHSRSLGNSWQDKLPGSTLRSPCLESFGGPRRRRRGRCQRSCEAQFLGGLGMWGACGSAGKESACNAGDLGSILGLGRAPEEGKGYALQYPGLENFMFYMTHAVAKS